MAVLDIVQDPSEVLRKKAKPVTKVNSSIKRLLDDMAHTMYEAPGVGLAAPQVGISKRLIVIDPPGEEEAEPLQLVNPEIIKSEGWVQAPEGCLSLPGYVGHVWRYEKVTVFALDRNGHKVWIDAEGWLARIFQHEIDHLDGILYTDKCSNFRETKNDEEESEAMTEVSEASVSKEA